MRAIPEVLMGPFVVGFDTLGYYVPNTLLWLRNGVGFWGFLAVAPFFYVLLMGATSVGVPIVVSLKVMAPLLLGFLGVAVYFYAYKTLSWSPKKSLVVALFATLYFVALRVSWDMLRSELALIFLFATLIFLKKEGIPIIMTVHDVYPQASKSIKKQKIFVDTWKRADKIVLLNNDEAKKLRSFNVKTPITIIPHGIYHFQNKNRINKKDD